jgi:N4-(beta-N-acetylglucosaminyl)-L-asparaginase
MQDPLSRRTFLGATGAAVSSANYLRKLPGRAGDSPIIGAGWYTDNDVGAAGSTGRGESNIMVCGAFFTVEQMRRGLAPTDACVETLRRTAALRDSAHLFVKPT